jgi:hypothetical protein
VRAISSVSASLAICFLISFAIPSNASAAIEAIQGKTYAITPRHGPWMIMVTSFWGETPSQEKSAAEAADQLVYLLRKKGIPAYTYRIDEHLEKVSTYDRLGRPRKSTYTDQQGMIGVLAGNYPSLEDRTAQQTLKFIKKFQPIVHVSTKDKPRDVPLNLAKAFITRNPVLSGDPSDQKVRDPVVLKLNSGVEHSLFENKGKYTLIVATFNGNSKIKPAQFGDFDKRLERREQIGLDQALIESWELVKTMRAQNIEAYVYHERYRSIVTVGSFDSDKDPAIRRYYDAFRAKQKQHPQTGADILLAESIQIPGAKDGDRPLKAWAMDPEPQLIEVPR